MKYILTFLYAIFNTLLCIIRYIIYFVIAFIWKFKLLKYSDVITNYGERYIRYESTTVCRSIPLEYDRNPWDTFKRSLKFKSIVNLDRF